MSKHIEGRVEVGEESRWGKGQQNASSRGRKHMEAMGAMVVNDFDGVKERWQGSSSDLENVHDLTTSQMNFTDSE